VTESAPVASFDRSSPVLAYWLANCEGFRVRSNGRTGVVKAVELGPSGRVRELVVGFGLGRKVAIPPEAVEAVVPAREVLVLEQPPPQAEAQRPARLAPAARRSADAARTGLGAGGQAAKRTGAGAGRAAVAVSLAAARAGSRTAVATKRESGRFVAWLAPRSERLGRDVSTGFDSVSARLVGLVAAAIGWLRGQQST
jgi:hypothetical protein